MKISYNWLKQYINIRLPAPKVAELLTDCGLEVSSLEKYQMVKGGLDGLVIGEVKTKSQHPNADRLSLTTVDTGNGNLLKIVCGAPNVAAGQKVVVAPVGTTIYPVSGEEIKIKRSKIRGEESEGMICAEDEIGLGTSHEGIMVLTGAAKAGTPAKDYFNMEDDWIFEIELTPNRIDAASHVGVARDLLAVISSQVEKAAGLQLNLPDVSGFRADNPDRKIDVVVENTEACPRYSGVTITHVEVKESPAWLHNRLKAIGQKPINNIVDITNFVLHELGQPLHAFDADEIEGEKITVKTLPRGARFITLDAKERELHPDDLMICNEKEGMCIAGVFGGIKSGVTEKTKNIFLESAHFNPKYIRKTAKRQDLHTEASFRFERGSDVNMTVFALQRAALLIKEIAGGKISSEIMDVYPRRIENSLVELDYEYCDRLIGKKIDRGLIKQILTSLQVEIKEERGEKLILSVPPFKVDVQRPADVVEEILRIYGYNNVEIPGQVRVSLNHTPKPEENKIRNIVSDFLSSGGFREIMSNSLTKSGYYKNEGEWKEENCVRMLNPLSVELNVMRQTLLFNGLEAIAYNQNRKNEDLRLYEFGNIYSLSAANKELRLTGFKEEQRLAIFLTGKKYPESWNSTGDKIDFYDLKEVAENIFCRLGIMGLTSSEEGETGYLYHCLRYKANGKLLAEAGKINPALLKKFDLRQEVFFADFHWDALFGLLKQNKAEFEELPKFPSVRRDLAMILDKKVQYSEIERLAFTAEKKLLKKINLFDVFEDEKGVKIPSDKKSYAVSFTFLDKEKTLTDIQVEKMMERLMNAYESELGAQIRK